MFATQAIHLLAGLSWDPAMRGILTVVLGVTILMGSIYLILATNTGIRLGMLLSLAGLFGWMTILTLTWWIQPPGIGPSGGVAPHWVAQDIVIGDETSEILAANTLPHEIESADTILAECPPLASQVPSTPVLSDIAGAVGANDATCTDGVLAVGKALVPQRNDLGGWKIVPTSEAGEAQTAADTALVASGLFSDATGYKKLSVFDYGGNPTLEDDCPQAVGVKAKQLVPEDPICRLTARIKKTFRLWHPPHYTIVQVQPVITQVAKTGEPPPTPVIDETKPVISVVLIRDQGNVRAKPAAFFVICSSLFVALCLMLHFRDKNEWANRAKTLDTVDSGDAGKG